MASMVKAEEKVEKIRSIMVELGLPFKQVFGQRIFGPPRNYFGERPAKGCEVFVTNIPRDVCEDEIIRLFALAGRLYEVKFMMEFSGMNRGFGYFLYVNRRGAMKAIEMYHGFAINANKKKLACYISLDNSKLYVEGIPTRMSVELAEKIFKGLFEDCAKVTIFRDPVTAKKNLGIGFIEFPTHRRAAEVRKLLWPSRIGLIDSNLFFEWAVPLPNFREYHILLVVNLTHTVNNRSFTNFVLQQIQERGYICNITKRGSFATIQCLSQGEAYECAEQLAEKMLDGHPLRVFMVNNKGNTHDQLILFLQWAVYEQRSVVLAALYEFIECPLSCIAKLAPQMRHYLRDTNAQLKEVRPQIASEVRPGNGQGANDEYCGALF